MRKSRICSDFSYVQGNGIRPVLIFAPSLLVEYDDGGDETDDPNAEKAVYGFYLRYVFDWSNFNSNHVGESPLSYEAWKVKTGEQEPY